VVVVYLIGAPGDTVVSIPALRVIRGAVGPETEIALLHNVEKTARVTPAEVLSGSGLVDKFIAYGSGGNRASKIIAVLKMWWNVRRLGAEKVFYLAPGSRSRSSVRRDRAFFRLCGIRQLSGFHFVEENDSKTDDQRGLKQVMHEALLRTERLAREGLKNTAAYSFPLIRPPTEARAAVAKWLDQSRSRGDAPLIAICPGSQMQSKLWPAGRFAVLGRRLLDKHTVEIVVVGGPAERALGTHLINEWGDGLNAAGVFGVQETAALLEACAFAVTLDTGPMHLAAAVGTKCVALFSGIESPGKWDPLGAGHVIIRRDVPCACCRNTTCPIEAHPCMTDITVEEVWGRVEALMCGIEAASGRTSPWK
jgi:heptosyltransferase-3